MVHHDLMRGEGWIRCCICGTLHERPYAGLALDVEGDRWDLCKGDCARDAGVREAPKDWLVIDGVICDAKVGALLEDLGISAEQVADRIMELGGP